MKENYNTINRRGFLKTMGAAGIGTLLSWRQIKAGPNEPNAKGTEQEAEILRVPRRKLGKTVIEVPILSLGIEFNAVENQTVLQKALDFGVNYWDTAETYAGGNSARGVGKFLQNNPKVRGELFIATKASGTKGSYDELKPEAADIERCLEGSLKRLNSKYIDVYFGFHGLSEPVYLTEELRGWARSAKERKLIRFFGFSTHENMAECLLAAAKLDWIDVVMTAYNFRLMQDTEMQSAVEACHKAGIGLIAIKTQAFGQKFETEGDKKLVKDYLERGFTEGQAKIKVVLDDKRFSSACVGMENVDLLRTNVAAVLDRTEPA